MIFAELLAVEAKKVCILLFDRKFYASQFGNCIQTGYCWCSAALSSSCIKLILGIFVDIVKIYSSICFI